MASAAPDGPAVDVVILSWHRRSETARAVDSVVCQRDVHPQVWLVDQGSEPDCVADLEKLARRHDDLHLIRLDRNVGVPAGRNIGIRRGRAPVVVGLDNDVVLPDPYALSRVVAAFRARPRLGALAWRVVSLDGTDDELVRVHRRSRPADEAFPAARFCGAAHAVRRTAFEQCGGYDDALFFYWEETDLCRRLLDRGWRVEYSPEVRAVHSRSPEARLGWRDGRYYYCVRNRLYLEDRFAAGTARLVLLAAGYLAQGVRNGLGREAVRGMVAAVALVARERRRRPRARLAPATRAYLREHEGVSGTSTADRLRALVTPLPADTS